jgi:hypothetical protein
LRDDAGEPVAQGLVVNMIDQRVRKLTPEFMSYTIAKMGLWALTRTAAQGLRRRSGSTRSARPNPAGRAAVGEHFARQRAATVLQRGAGPRRHDRGTVLFS